MRTRLWLLTLGCLLAFLSTTQANVRLTNDPSSSERPAVAINSVGTAVVVWQDDRDGNYEIYWRKFTSLGVPLTSEIRVTNTTSKSARPDIACDAAGKSYLVWQEGENVNGVGTVYFCILDANGSRVLANDIALDTFAGDPRVSTRSDGVSAVAWHHFAPTNQDVVFRRLSTTGTTQCEKRFNKGTLPAISKTPVIVLASPTAAIYWRDMDTGFSIQLYEGAINGSCQSGSGVMYPNANAVHPDADAAENGGGIVWPVFELGGRIYNFLGGQNVCALTSESGIATYPRVATDAEKGFVVWRDTRDGNSEIYTCRYHDSGCPSETGDVRLTNDPASSDRPDIAAEKDNTGHWVAVWQDNRNGNWEIYMTGMEIRGSGALSGQVAELGGSPTLPGATVSLLQGEVVVATATTGPDGVYLTPLVAAGTYDLRVEMPLYETYEEPGITIQAGLTTIKNVELHLASLTLQVFGRVRDTVREDPLIDRPLEGVKVTLQVNGVQQGEPQITNSEGVATFTHGLVTNAEYIMELKGPYYNITVHRKGFAGVPTQSASVVTTNQPYVWLSDMTLDNGPASQAAYYANHFRKTYWLDRLGYEWELPTRFPGNEYNDMTIQIYETEEETDCGSDDGAACATFDVGLINRERLNFWRDKVLDADVLYHEYGHAVVFDRFKDICGGVRLIGTDLAETDDYDEYSEGAAMDEALADYFAASFTDDPIIDSHNKHICHSVLGLPCYYTWRYRSDISKHKKNPSSGYHFKSDEGSRILSSALWHLRDIIDDATPGEAPITDHLVFGALNRMITDNNTLDAKYRFEDFYDAMVAVDQSNYGGQYASLIDEAFDKNNIINPVEFLPLYFPPGSGFWGVDGSLASVELSWNSVPGAESYEIKLASVSRGDGSIGIGGFAAVDTTADTTYVLHNRERNTEYLIAIAPIDSSGEVGYMCDPAYVPRLLPRTDKKFQEEPNAVDNSQGDWTGGRWLFSSPNPFNPETRINFETGSAGRVELRIYDVSGRKVRTFSEMFPRGVNCFTWDGSDGNGTRVASGQYFVVLEGRAWRARGKVLLLR